MNFVDKNH